MIAAVGDTHAVLWYLFGDKRLSLTARNFFEATAIDGDQIAVSSISFVEIIYLVERQRIHIDSYEQVRRAFDLPQSLLLEIPVNAEIAESVSQVNAKQVPDMPDRIIAATAVFLKVPLISRDRKIQASTVQTLW